jgi:hypothetical protein
MLVIFTMISALTAIFSYDSSVDTSRIINRPYVNLHDVRFDFFDQAGQQLTSGSPWEKVKYVDIVFEVSSHGSIPAVVTRVDINSPGLGFSTSSEMQFIIFNDGSPAFGKFRIPVDNFMEAVHSSGGHFFIGEKMEYKIPGEKIRYYSAATSSCHLRTFEENGGDISCGIIEAVIN